jgi:uncharacterized RDD family membrane protein YckC
MYALKRIAAYGIDMLLVWMPLAALTRYGETWILSGSHRRMLMVGGIAAWGFTIIGPVIVNGILTGLTGRTLGKLILFLRVKDAGGDPPGVAQGILRELIKAVSLGFFFGMIYALQGLVVSGQTYYDAWLDLDVEDLKPVGLTDTQKKWRKYHRELERKNRK